MRIVRTEDYQAMSRQTAALVASQIVSKPESVLGLATGSTPVGTYWHLVEWCRMGMISFSHVRTVNLDEYHGLAPEHEKSHRHFMKSYLLEKVDIPEEQTFAPDGMALNTTGECARYEALVKGLGGADLILLGLGHNGHIGFNEPGSSFVAPTHMVDLTKSTLQANARIFGSEDMVPRRAITLGMAGIMAAKRVVVAVSGADKADIVARAFEGPITPEVPASILQLHPDMVLVADRAALSCMRK